MKVFVSRQIAPSAIEKLKARFDTTVWSGALPPTADELRRAVADCDGLVSMLTDRIDQALLDAGPKLLVVSNVAVGFDNIDLQACAKRGVKVGHTPGVLAEAVADFTFALLLGVTRRIADADRYVRSGVWKTWNPQLLLGHDLRGKTLGIAGYGGIGKALHRRAEAFGMRVIFHNRSDLKAVDKATLLRESDFLSIHLPLSEATRHWLGRDELRAMKDGSTVINTARGPVIDQAALVEALKAGKPAFAAIDVFDPEPPKADEPLLALPNVLLAPHLGSATVETREQMALLAVENAMAVLEGRHAPHLVTQPSS